MTRDVFSPAESRLLQAALGRYKGNFFDAESHATIDAMAAKVAGMAPARFAWKRYGGKGPNGQGYQTRLGHRVFTAWPVASGWNVSVHIHGTLGDNGALRVAGSGETRDLAVESAIARESGQ